MNKIIFIFMIMNVFIFSTERLSWDVFVGHDVYGLMRVDRTEIEENYDDYSFNFKTNLSYKVYRSMDFIVSVGYDEYYMPTYKDSYSIIPLSFGMRFVDRSKKDIHPYVGFMYGANILQDEESFPINTEKNGYAEANFGILYKDKYFTELSYKHHAFAYIPKWPSNNYWNGKMIGLNLGYRIK